ncbi:MAG TPA: hypothetical protein VLK33_19775 [Terriglobales bacterium]|nr:hypothetical protein [Terriglobales bacterium]
MPAKTLNHRGRKDGAEIAEKSNYHFLPLPLIAPSITSPSIVLSGFTPRMRAMVGAKIDVVDVEREALPDVRSSCVEQSSHVIRRNLPKKVSSIDSFASGNVIERMKNRQG